VASSPHAAGTSLGISIPARVATSRKTAFAKNAVSAPSSAVRLAALLARPTPTPAPAPQKGHIIRVGLSTRGGPIMLWSQSPLVITDGYQTGRRLTARANENVTFTYGGAPSVTIGPHVWSGPIQIRIGGGISSAWRMPRIEAFGGPTRISTNGQNPRWQRAYRGSFEVAEQTFSFEPAAHQSRLRLVNIIALEEYLKGVVPWEMDPSAPLEALKAQAICARSETLAKIQGGRHTADGYDICDYDHCQGYSGTENEEPNSSLAVEQTAGLVIYYKGRIADAVYGTNSGGITADKSDVWQGSPIPYLQSVRDLSPGRHAATARLLKPSMTEADWVSYCTRNLPSYAQPSAREVAALAVRRRASPRAAALFQEGDLPEFYRWTRVIRPNVLAQAMASRTPMDIVTDIRVVERAPSGHIKRLQIVGRSQTYKPVTGGSANGGSTNGGHAPGGGANGGTLGGAVVNSGNPNDGSTTNGDAANGGIPDAGSVVTVTLEKDSQIRAMLSGRLGSTTALPSSTFVVLPRRDAQGTLIAWVLKGAGWGHGAGMCQRGAQNHAREGWDARRIIQHYFRGAELRDTFR
jgi:peptidoglycan hydrolase-like amidase